MPDVGILLCWRRKGLRPLGCLRSGAPGHDPPRHKRTRLRLHQRVRAVYFVSLGPAGILPRRFLLWRATSYFCTVQK
eukprot:g41319.t1